MSSSYPVALTVAGSDPSGGAGIQADLKTFYAFGVYGCSVITAITAQNTRGVRESLHLPPDLVVAQLDAVLEDLSPAAVKTGMLGSAGVVEALSRRLEACGIPLVVDPVMVSGSGDRLLEPKGVRSLQEKLLPLALIATPNLAEAEALTDMAIADRPGMEEAAKKILELGPTWVLVKGGHLVEGASPDYLLGPSGGLWLAGDRVETTCTHGTGCTLSAAIAAGLSRGLDVADACRQAKAYLTEALASAFPVGKGTNPVNHFAGDPLPRRFWSA